MKAARISPLSAYKERVDAPTTWHESLLRFLYGRIWWPLSGCIFDHSRSLRKILPLVERHERRLEVLGDADLKAHASELKEVFRRQPKSIELSARALAIVRIVGFRTLSRRAHDVQIMGAFALLHGQLVEMATGEGKTLTAALAAASAALTGAPVHVVTVNDYLAERDAQIMTPVFSYLGLTIGIIVSGMDPEKRRNAYKNNITYCSNKELAFDYLKDRVALAKSGGKVKMAFDSLLNPTSSGASGFLLRGLCYAIVDEADSIFIDEAATPLILSESVDSSKEVDLYENAISMAKNLVDGMHYVVDERSRHIELTDDGKDFLVGLTAGRSGVLGSWRMRNELVTQALQALHLFHKDQQYVVAGEKIEIVDEFTGRILPDRSWENGLHQMIEVKEGCTLSERRVTIARITYQKLFRRYVSLSGMTGTAKEVAGEIWSVYRLRTVAIPLHRPSRRKRFPDQLFSCSDQKLKAVVERVRQLAIVEGRSVLIGTRSVEASEKISEVLRLVGIDHALLNAKQDKDEAEAVASAGKPRQVTVATNMAGRGTDIHLDPQVLASGGLHVILTECHTSRRIDRQLIGRCARQGDPGSYEYILAFDDEILKVYSGALMKFFGRYFKSMAIRNQFVITFLRFFAQTRAGLIEAKTRKLLLKQDERLNTTLAFSGAQE